MKIVTVVGVRPEFIMASPVSAAIASAGHDEVLVHTGQHYDELLSDVFFQELDLPFRVRNLGVGSAPRHRQLGEMAEGVESVLDEENPDLVLVYGDTNSTCAGAIAAASGGIPIIHVEAGVRSFDRSMPEERNRELTDRLADLLLAPTRIAVSNLARAGVNGAVHLTGDVRRDALARVQDTPKWTDSHDLLPDDSSEYVVATVHRQATVTNPDRLCSVFHGLAAAHSSVIVPLHPNTADRLRAAGVYSWLDSRLHLVEPVGYPTFVRLVERARCVATDSGGIQREAMMLGTPCVTLRNRTEWPETVARGSNVLVGTDPGAIRRGIDRAVDRSIQPICPPAGVSRRIVRAIDLAFGDSSREGGSRTTCRRRIAPIEGATVFSGQGRRVDDRSGDERRTSDGDHPRGEP